MTDEPDTPAAAGATPPVAAAPAPAAPAPGLGEAGRAFLAALRQSGASGLAAGREAARRGASAARARLGSVRAGRRAEGLIGPPAPPAASPPRRSTRRRPALGSRAIRRGWRLVLGILGGLALGAALAVGALWWVMRDLPLSDALPPLEQASVAITTADGDLLTTRGAFRAPYVGFEEFPPHLVDAVIAIEDRRFRDHGGVDPRGILRALVRNVTAGGVVEGGSTITQQLVKVLYLEPDRTLTRKLQEVALALSLERQLDKDRILELYLNSVYLGSGAYGMPAAARTYFDKAVADLTLPEAALLAASIQLPSQVNPIADLGAAQNRGALVLTLMAQEGLIDDEARDGALARIATLVPDPPAERDGSYFADWAIEQAAAIGGDVPLALTATATLDPALQAEAERIVESVMASEGAAAGASQAALVAMTPSGEVRAMVGGLRYADSEFNRATEAFRQPGSTFKLMVYLTAFTGGATPDSQIEDEPVEIDGWSPGNFDGQSHGVVTLREAFAQSYNQAAVRLGQAVGIDNVILVARQLGIEGDLAATPSLALGTSEVTLIDMTEAYAAVALGRAPVTATGLTDIRLGEAGATLGVAGDGAVEEVRLTRTLAPLQDILGAVIEEGTGREARVEGVLGGKTGTSQESRDAWFIGYTNDLVVGVWVGNDDNAPMDRVTGGGIPARIFAQLVQAHRDLRMGAAITAQVVAAQAAESAAAAPLQCDVRACSAAYRSFRASDCTFQPFSGPRRLCTR